MLNRVAQGTFAHRSSQNVIAGYRTHSAHGGKTLRKRLTRGPCDTCTHTHTLTLQRHGFNKRRQVPHFARHIVEMIAEHTQTCSKSCTVLHSKYGFCANSIWKHTLWGALFANAPAGFSTCYYRPIRHDIVMVHLMLSLILTMT